MLQAAIKQTHPEMVAYVSMHGPYQQMPAGFERLYHWITAHHLDPKGMPAATYYTDPSRTPEEEAIWEIRAPVGTDAAEAEPDENGIGVRHMPPTTVASAVHKGSYESVAETYADLLDWIISQGYVIVGPAEEHYLSEPDTPPERVLTEIRMPVSQG